MLDDIFLEKVKEITRLHDEAFEHYQKFDQHCKISDGSISVHVEFGSVHERREEPDFAPRISLAIYSYVVGIPEEEQFEAPRYYFETIDEALEKVRAWHARAMEWNPSEEEQAEWDQMASDFLNTLAEQGRLSIYEIDEDGESHTIIEGNPISTANSDIACVHCGAEVAEGEIDGTTYCNCGRVAFYTRNGYTKLLAYPEDLL
jgi:hypothetical protein